MFFKPYLGMQGNIEESLKRNQQVRNQIHNMATELKETESLTLELAADHEARLCEMELGVN